MDNRLDELRMERDELEARLLALEQAAEQQRQLHLMAAEEQARQDAGDLAAGIEELLARLAVVNTQLALRRTPSALQKARVRPAGCEGN